MSFGEGMLPILREPANRRSRGPQGGLGSTNHWRIIPLPDSSGSGSCDGIPCARASAPSFFGFSRGAERRWPFARGSGFGSVSSFQPMRTSQCTAAPEHVGLNQHGRVQRLRIWFRMSSDNANVAYPTDANWFRLGALFGSADLTLLAGDFVPGFQDYPGGAGP